MKKFLALLLLLSVQACSESNSTLNNTPHIDKLETSNTKSLAKENANSNISNGIYFSYKKCNSEKACKTVSPVKINNKYYLSKDQNSDEDQYYLLANSNKYYIYSLQFLDEDARAVGSWSEIKKINSSNLSFKVKTIEQVIGSDYMGSYDNSNLNKKLNTSSHQSGLLEIGSLIEGNELSTNETIKFIHTNDGYKVDCENYIKEYERVVDQLTKRNMAVGFHFYYECANGNTIFFQDVSQLR